MDYYFPYAPVATDRASARPGTPYAVPGLDVQSDQAYVVAPPSLCARARTYQFLEDTVRWLERLPPLPAPIIARMRAAKSFLYGGEMLARTRLHGRPESE